MTDETPSYFGVGSEFAGHSTVHHLINEYARFGGFVHTSAAECRFSLVTRADYGAHHSVSEAHRYLSEWNFQVEHAKDDR